MKRLSFNAFVMNTASHIQHGQWRRPDARQHDFNDVDVWIDLARTLEGAKFDAMFFADVSGLYGDSDADYSVYHSPVLAPSSDSAMATAGLCHITSIGSGAAPNCSTIWATGPSNSALSTLGDIRCPPSAFAVWQGDTRVRADVTAGAERPPRRSKPGPAQRADPR
jgi:hypothetical protein